MAAHNAIRFTLNARGLIYRAKSSSLERSAFRQGAFGMAELELSSGPGPSAPQESTKIWVLLISITRDFALGLWMSSSLQVQEFLCPGESVRVASHG